MIGDAVIARVPQLANFAAVCGWRDEAAYAISTCITALRDGQRKLFGFDCAACGHVEMIDERVAYYALSSGAFESRIIDDLYWHINIVHFVVVDHDGGDEDRSES